MAKFGTDVEWAASLLRSGKLVGIPTETVYGLAAHGLDEAAVAAIFEAKQRPHFDPLILHVPSATHAQNYVATWPKTAQSLADAFWPGPLTLVLPKKNTVPDLVTSAQPTVAVRVPNHPLTLQLLNLLPFPLAAPSANPFGYVSPTSAQHVLNQLENKIDYVLDGGPCEKGLESTIIDLSSPVPTLLRLGSIPIEDIEKVIGPIHVKVNQNSNPTAPGMLDQHYSPYCKLIPFQPFIPINAEQTTQQSNQSTPVLSDILQQFPAESIALLSYSSQDFQQFPLQWQAAIPHHFVLTNTQNDYTQAASNLFKTLRSFDEQQLKCVLFTWAPQENLGLAINDRLQRAAAKR